MKKIVWIVIALSIVMLNTSISFASSDLLLPPVIQGNKDLNSPPEVVNYQLAGTVSLKINILRDGTIGKISITKSSGYEVLDKAALDAARSWTYLPARDKNGHPIDINVLTGVVFQSSNKTFSIVKAVIDGWDPRRLDTYSNPGIYNSMIEPIHEQIKLFDFNNSDKSLTDLVAIIGTMDSDKKYNINVYHAVARKLIKEVYPEHDVSRQWIQKARGAELEDKYKEAIAYYDKAVVQEPYDADYYYRRGFAYFSIHNNVEAIVNYDKAIELEPNNSYYYHLRGTNYSFLHDYANALRDCSKAIELNSKNDDYYYYDRGRVYYHLNQYQEAIADYTKAITINNDSDRYYAGRGESYYAIKQYREAIEDYSKAIERTRNTTFLEIYYSHRGKIYLAVHDYQQALDDFNKVLSMDYSYPELYNDRGQAYYGLGDYKNAISDYSRAIDKVANKPKFNAIKVDWYLNRADAYKKMGIDKEAALDELEAKNLKAMQGKTSSE